METSISRTIVELVKSRNMVGAKKIIQDTLGSSSWDEIINDTQKRCELFHQYLNTYDEAQAAIRNL